MIGRSGSCDTRPVESTSYRNAHIDAVAVARDGTPFVDLVPSGTWRITDAFGIAANDRILAVVSRQHGSIRVLLLDPVSR